MPPVRHGDLLSLEVVAGDVVVIVDGLFHQAAPVRHKEILHILDSGVTVIGAGSMGALRAAELDIYGMVGVGLVYDWYRSGQIEADDEVAVANLGYDDFRQLSEPLVNVRYAAQDAMKNGLLEQHQAEALIQLAQKLPYYCRSWQAIMRLAQEYCPEMSSAIGTLISTLRCRPHDWNIKRIDALEALRLVASRKPQSGQVRRLSPDEWRTYYLDAWRSRYRSFRIGHVSVPALAVLQHQQFFDPCFPQRWRRYVIRRISGTFDTVHDEELSNLLVLSARDAGFSLEYLSEHQKDYWLSANERQSLDSTEQMLRILIRAAHIHPGLLPTEALDPRPGGLVDPGLDSVRVVADAFNLNRSKAATDPQRTIHHIRRDRLSQVLIEQWELEVINLGALNARARDSGFGSWDDALNVFRHFYWWARIRGTHKDTRDAAALGPSAPNP